MNKNTFWNNPWYLTITAAIFLSLAFPPINLAILQIPAFVFLFRVALISNSTRQMILYAYPCFVLWNLFTTYWLMMADLAAGVAAILANAVLMLIPLWLARKMFLSKLNPILASFLAAAFWVSYEFLHHNWDLAWPWLTLGNAWSNLTGVIQYISVTGVFGISFWVVFTAALAYQYIHTKSKYLLYSTLLIFFAFPVFSALAMIVSVSEEGKPVEVVIVQPNSDSYTNYGGMESLDELLSKLLRMSGEAVTDDTDVIIWPENAVDASLTLENGFTSRIQDSLRVWGTELITGTGFLNYYENGEMPVLTRGTADGRRYNVYNAAFHIQPGERTNFYEKGKLVPVVERFPFVNFFHHLDIYGWINWANLAGYGHGQEAKVFNIDGGKTPALICYDSVFPSWVNQFVNNGADFITIITNDGWWGDTSGHSQHFAYARLRAIEHRKWIARSANNGISGIISPDGKIQHETEYWTEDAFSFTIYRSDKKTFYTAYGDWLAYLMLISSFFGLFYKPEFD
ncbi:MAG: apolipoprotein N-acyltransferase [Balneolaceae bacterium]